MSIIFYHNSEQEELAKETKAEQERILGQQIQTEVRPASGFCMAEAYHQKYYLRYAPAFWREFRDLYPMEDDLVNSTAVARVNGYLGGYGRLRDLQAEIDRLGLSQDIAKELLEMVSLRTGSTEQCPLPESAG